MWTAEQEAEYKGVTDRLRELKNERERAELSVKNAVASFVREKMKISAGSDMAQVAEAIIFRHRRELQEFLNQLPDLEI